MLEIRNISKTYRAKSGVSVKALDHVSLTFAETGMVFLLGKSGSGKSTLLNVIGGLDTYDEGEIIIKGRTSRKFRGSDFDAYRNTFIGFIFQEYNILDEFSVGANIGLALELQGKKATNEAINAILTQVDLLDFASRKPNELSGGQKQRIAIARALIKDPQIIMADEPTGALDSATGKQVLETLKKLSETKLVLVVSHDREFAEKYGDRIIELSDGRVISDMSLDSGSVDDAPITEEEMEEPSEDETPAGITIVDDSVIHISRGYTLTLEDMDMINAYLRKGDKDIVLSKDDEINEDVRTKWGLKRATKKAGKGKAKARIFGRKPTGAVKVKTYNPAETRFIKSRLPLKNAVKIGSASMKAKPIRLIFTIFLSFIAFTMFGLADTMAAYNQYTAMADSLRDSNMQSIAFSLYLREEHMYKRDGEWISEVYYNGREDTMTDEDIAALEAETGLSFKGVYNGRYNSYDGFSISHMFLQSNNLYNNNGYSFFEQQHIGGMVELTEQEAEQMGYTIEGRFPQNESEIVITQYTFKMLQLAGLHFSNGVEVTAGNLNTSTDPKDTNSILGKSITLANREFTIVGVLDTGFDFDNVKYEAFHWDYNGVVRDNDIWTLQMALESEIRYSYHRLAVCYTGVIDTLPKPEGGYREYGASFWGNYSPFLLFVDKENNSKERQHYSLFVGKEEGEQFGILWLQDGKTSLGAGEIVLPIDYCFNLQASKLGYDFYHPVIPDMLKGIYDENSLNMRDFLEEHVYNAYVANCKSKDPLTYEEYKAEIYKFYNAYYDLDISAELWNISRSYMGNILESTPMMNMDEYAINRASWCFLLSHWDVVEREMQDSTEGFGQYLANIGYDPTQMEGYSDEEKKGIILCYATQYMREYNYLQLFGQEQTPKQMAEDEMKLCEEKYAARMNRLYGVDFSYETWIALINRYGSNYLKGYTSHLNIQEYVREVELFNQITALDVDEIMAEALTKGSNFNFYLENYGYDLNELFGKGSEDFKQGVCLALALQYADECYYSGTRAFGLDVRTLIDQKTKDYIIQGAKGITLPDVYLGFDVYVEGGSSREDVEYDTPYTIVGFFNSDNDQQRNCVISEELYQKALATQQSNSDYRTILGKHASGRYVMALAVLPHDDRAVLDAITTLHHREGGEYEFRMRNNVASVIDDWGETILMFNQIFLYVGIGFAVFASLMMLNFISVSVTHKKKEIGILRALGARSSDVFSIFFSEAFFVALINFTLATIAVFVASYFINSAVRTELGFPITLLHAGIRQIALVFGVSVLVAFVGSFFPVSKIARKNPIDAMRDR